MSVMTGVASPKPIAAPGCAKAEFEQMVHAAANGDRSARDLCLAVILPMAQRYCRARMGNRDVGVHSAADVAQEVCIAALKALPRYQDSGGSFTHVVYAIASNKVADVYRAASRDRSNPVADVPDFFELADEPESQAMAAELRVRMARILATLSVTQREVLILRIAVGLSACETASAVNASEGHVRVIQHRALARLRAVMAADAHL